MAKTIMVSDDIYGRLSKIKKKTNKSFSQLLENLMEKDNKKRKYESLLNIKGSWKESPEDEKIEKELKKEWGKWNRQYA